MVRKGISWLRSHELTASQGLLLGRLLTVGFELANVEALRVGSRRRKQKKKEKNTHLVQNGLKMSKSESSHS